MRGCSRTIKRPCLNGTGFGALESISESFYTLQTAPKLAAKSRQLIEANAFHRSLKTARLDENNVVAGSVGYYI